MLRWLSALLLCVLANTASAQDNATASRIAAAFETWLEAEDTEGVIAIRFEGAPVTVASFGVPAEAQVELASVSKSIAAICAYTLVRDGLLRYDATFADVFGRGPSVTVAQLILHTSGLIKDSTQRDMPRWFREPPDRAKDVLSRVVKRGVDGEADAYAYNNENYALLGLVIEAVTDAPFEETCRKRVLDPAGVSGGPSPVAGAYLPWGGWVMRADDYAALHAHWYAPGGQLAAPLDHPHVDLGGGLYHGLGSFFRVGNGLANHWYFGALCMPGRINIGSYAVNWGGGWSLLAAYEACVDWDAMMRLDRVLAEAAFGQ